MRLIPSLTSMVALSMATTGSIVSASKEQALLPLSTSMQSMDFTSTSLVPIDFTLGIQELESISAQEAIMKNMGEFGTILFAVRRPG